MHRRLRRVVTAIVLLGALVVLVFPLYYLAITSLKTNAELYAPVPTLFPHSPSIGSYISDLLDRGMARMLINSVIAGLSATILALVIAFALCYPITRLPVGRGTRAFVLGWAMSLRFLPPIAVVIPALTIVRWLGIYNQLPALVLVYTTFNLPFTIWMLKGFLDEIPLEVEEAALVDGATRLQAFRRVLLPLSSTGVLAAGIIVFAFDWAEFPFAFILTATIQGMTFPVAVQGLVTQYAIVWNDMAAGGVIAIMFPLLLMVLARRHVLAGLTFGVIRDR
jgi:multiple sugar transport system permease protein